MNVLCLQNDGSSVDVHIHLVDYECFMFTERWFSVDVHIHLVDYDYECFMFTERLCYRTMVHIHLVDSVDVHIHLVDYECFMFTERWFLSRCTYTPC